MIQFMSYHRHNSFLGPLGHNFWLFGGMQEMGIYMYLLTRTDGPKSAHTKHAAQCQVSVHETQGATHTHTHTYNKSQCVLSKRSAAEPGQTEGGRRTSTGAEPVRQLPTFFVSSVHGHPTSALAKVTCTRSICCSYF